MQLTINHPSLTFSSTLLKPFLLVGVAAISSAALYSPLSSQSQNLKEKVTKDVIAPIAPFAEEGIEGSKKLFSKLGDWAKYSANKGESIKEWLKSLENGSVERGAKEIYKTLEDWAKKVYEFLKELLSEKAWEKFKQNVQKLGQLLNLFKNLMKLELGGNASIFDKVLGNSKVMDAMGGLIEKHPEILEQLNEKDLEDIGHALEAEPDKVAEKIKEMADSPEEKLDKNKLMNSIKQSALIGRIEKAIAEAEAIHAKAEKLTEEDKKKGAEVLQNLETLYAEVEAIIKKATPSSSKKK